MAGKHRTAADDLIRVLRQEPHRFDFFQAMRLFECAHADKPRLGTATRAVDDPVRVGQDPNMQFAPTALSSIAPECEGWPDRLEVRFLGLFGPNGPLPAHLTEYADTRRRHHDDPTFARFADIFHHRILCLFYRAWANGEPTVDFDRADDGRFTDYLGSLFGIGMDTFQQRDAMPDEAKLFFAGLMACQTRHPDGLVAIVRRFFRIPASVREFVGEWMPIARSDQTRLGITEHDGALGLSAVIGARVWARQFKYRVVLGPLDLGQYQALLPGGQSLSELVAIVRNYSGDELCWDVNLILLDSEVPSLRLDGSSQLGWTTWMGARAEGNDADDLLLNPFFGVAEGEH